MADDYAQNLPDIPERTDTADTDLVLVNSGGSDYKQIKLNFLKGNLAITFDQTSLITAQADALPDTGTYFGTLVSSGHQTETGTPLATFWYVRILCLSSYYRVIDLWGVDDPQANHYVKHKRNNTWASDWTKVPSRAEITSLNNSLANTLGKFPQNISSFSEFDALATSGGFHTFRTSASFTCGNGTMPNYGRGLIMNYSSSDSSFILCSPTGFVYGFKNSGNWLLKQLSF